MAIDAYSVKSSVSGETKYQNAKGSTGNSDIDFAELISGSGARVANSLWAISDGAGITSTVKAANQANTFDDRQQNPVEDHAEAYDDTDHGAEQSSHPAEQSVSGRHDDRARDPVANSNSEYSEPTGETSTEANTAHHDDSSAKPHDSSSSGESTGQKQTTNDNGETAGQAADSGEKTTDQAANGGENAVSGQSKGADSNAERILQSLLASTHGNTQAGPATDPRADTAKNTGPGENAAKGLTNALANATKNTGDAATPTGQDPANPEAGAKANAGASANAKDGFNLHAAQAAQEKAGNTPQSAASAANAQGQAATTEAAGKNAAAQQAAQLSRMVGDGPKVSVTVGTTGDSASVVSKPSSSLVSNGALIGETNSQNGRGHQAQNSAGATTGQAQANTPQTQTNAGQTQVAAVQATAQNQASASTGDAKSPMQAAQQIGQAGPVAAGAGEGAAVTGNVNATHQAQNSGAAQASNAPRQALPGQAVTDQVTIQISKAANAGVDKISIHLKPADLGRVDVKMEVGHDGRLTAVVTADNKNTLDLLQKDSKELQQALQDAGLQMDNDSLSFNLREQGEEAQTAGSGRPGDGGENPDGDENALGDPLANHRNIVTDTRVDIRA